MIRDELFAVIMNFEEALKKERCPNFGKNLHRVEQVLRILKNEFHDFYEHESRRACDTRDLWENFWSYPEVQKALKEYKANRNLRVRARKW